MKLNKYFSLSLKRQDKLKTQLDQLKMELESEKEMNSNLRESKHTLVKQVVQAKTSEKEKEAQIAELEGQVSKHS